MKTKREFRSFAFEVRAEENEEHGHYIVGRPIVYDSTTDLGWFFETIERGALDGADMKDVRFLVNHDTMMIPLARSRNNNVNSTMQLSIVNEGLDIRVDLDTENNADARKLYSAVKRGDITGMSFMFKVEECRWEDMDTEKPHRYITKFAKIFEVSAVTFPAYEDTSIEAASHDGALESAKSTLESARAKINDVNKRKIEIIKEQIAILAVS